jgi:tetratricopeptide (TPR) repeat protein
MSWQQTEFLLKGIFLGVLVYVGLQLREPSGWADVGYLTLFMLGGLVLCLGVAAVRKLREGYRVKGRLTAFILFLLLENPGLVYAGVLLGLAGGAFMLTEYSDLTADKDRQTLIITLGGGVVLGYCLDLLRQVQVQKVRRWLGLALVALLIGMAVGVINLDETLLPTGGQRTLLAVLILAGIPFFYVLTLSSMAEESEVEIAAISAALGVSLWLLSDHMKHISPNFPALALIVPVGVYVVYTWRILPGLRVFKHVLRGISYATVGRFRPSLLSLKRALELDPKNALAHEQLWSVHRMMDFDQVARDPELLELVDFDLCLERVAELLLPARPSAEHLAEAERLMKLIAGQRPRMQPRCDYWRAVSFLHQRRPDEAAELLVRVIGGHYPDPNNPHRQVILYQAWLLALLIHPDMKHRVGTSQLAKPGMRMEAIAAVERQLAQAPDDSVAWDLKRLLYNDLTESLYVEAVPEGGAAKHFDHEYAQQLGLGQINEPARWQRGCQYLRMAARGLPAQATALFYQIAKAHERAGEFNAVWENYELAKRTGKAFGSKNLSNEDRQLYFAIIKVLGEDALKRGDLDAAVENYHLYTEYERAGVETYRTLADLYEKKGESWSALYCTEQALLYNSDDDLLKRKDRYYYSIKPEELEAKRESVQKWFDVAYCIQKAKWVLDKSQADLDVLDWASHLVELAQVMQPASQNVRVLRARILRRRGEQDKATALLEDVRTNRPEKFPSSEEEDAWYLACRLLGDIYLEDHPDKAVECFLEYRKSPKSGADTWFKLARAYELLGDRLRAVKCYQQVAAYESHPLAPDANDALHRLKTTV